MLKVLASITLLLIRQCMLRVHSQREFFWKAECRGGVWDSGLQKITSLREVTDPTFIGICETAVEHAYARLMSILEFFSPIFLVKCTRVRQRYRCER